MRTNLAAAVLLAGALGAMAHIATPAAHAADAPAVVAMDPSTPEAVAAFDMLAAAVAKAGTYADTRFAFAATRVQQVKDDAPFTLVGDFDPRREVGALWRITSPDPETADKSVRKTIDQLQKADGSDSVLVYDGLGKMENLALVENGPERAVFVSRDLGDRAPEGALEARLVVEKATGHITSIEVVSLKSFKPSPIVKIISLRQFDEFAPPAGDGPALLRRSASFAEGSAAFNGFKMAVETVFSDVQTVDAPPREDAATTSAE